MQHLRTGNGKSARESWMVRRIRFAFPSHWKEYMDAGFKILGGQLEEERKSGLLWQLRLYSK